MLADMDMVPREEFEAVRAMAQKARSEQEEMAARLAELERRMAGTSAPGDQPVAAATGAATGRRMARPKAEGQPRAAPRPRSAVRPRPPKTES
jgi:hypothetical protein